MTHTRGRILEENHYYPFGLVMANLSSKAIAGLENKFKYNGKEEQRREFSDLSGLEWLDYGARMYDAQVGRWSISDSKSEFYFSHSAYIYALNQPTHAIDPDGNIVIFVNGNHYDIMPPHEKYWTTSVRKTDPKKVSLFNLSGEYYVSLQFDKIIMQILKDFHKPQYYDGSVGGWHPIFDDKRFSATAKGRYVKGFEQGLMDAKSIIDNLARDKSGNIIETIKVVTHSMGGAYGKGLVAALKVYINTLPIALQKQIKITLVVDFDPFQAGDIKADPDIKTLQFKHEKFLNFLGMGL